MADFLVVLGDSPTAHRWRAAGVHIAAALGAGTPSAAVEQPDLAAWTWRRRDGSRGAVAAEHGGDLLLAAGSWFGPDDLHSGSEPALLARVAARGIEPVARELDGFFTLVHAGASEPGVVAVATDPIGSHLAHVRYGDGACAVAASPLWLAALGEPALDAVGCQEFLATGILYEDRTLFRDVRRLPPAAVVWLGAAGPLRNAQTWQIGALEPGSLAAAAAVDAFGAGMRDAVRRAARGAERPICDLTAGWDSRLLVAFLLDAGIAFDTTVTGDASSADVRLSLRIADAFGLRHHVIDTPTPPDLALLEEARALCDGEVDVLDYARIASVQRALLPRFGTSWNGSFGEVARGYWWEILEPSPGAVARLDAARVASQRYAKGAIATRLWPESERLDPLRHMTEVVARCDAAIDRDAPLGFRLDHAYLRMRMRCWQGRIASSTDRLRACLSPLIFRSVLEPLLRTRPEDRARNRLARRTLARFAPELAALPLEAGGPALPMSAANAWRFAPELMNLVRRATRKLLRGRGSPEPAFARDARLALWRDPRFEVRFAPRELALAQHVVPAELERLVIASRQPDFADEALFGRLLGIELALRAHSRATAERAAAR
ncbi:MAG: hypothetical protein IPM29_29895 [Planctomycetes bacterium]|nr:hypothetical protein [Planctomycetota bacterium]